MTDARRGWRSAMGEEWILAMASVAFAAMWTLMGVLTAAIGNQLTDFLREWVLIQGTFAVLAAALLFLLSRSSILASAIGEVKAMDPQPLSAGPTYSVKRLRRPVIIGIASVGTVSTTQLGFSVEPPALIFMWLTCLLVCVAAGFVTWHFIEILTSAARLSAADIEVFAYSPGETWSLRRLASYYAAFGVATTVGYLFAFTGTVANSWEGPPALVRAVQSLWPTIYVPFCIVLLIYPHLAIRKVVRDAKWRIIGRHQRQINLILNTKEDLDPADVAQINSLAELIGKIEKTPDFALRFPIVISAIATSLANIATLIIPHEAIAQVVRSRLPWL